MTQGQVCEDQSRSTAPERLVNSAYPSKGDCNLMPTSDQVTCGRPWDSCSEVPGFRRSGNKQCMEDFPTWQTSLVHPEGRGAPVLPEEDQVESCLDRAGGQAKGLWGTSKPEYGYTPQPALEKPVFSQGHTRFVFYPSTPEAKAGTFLHSRPASAVHGDHISK